MLSKKSSLLMAVTTAITAVSAPSALAQESSFAIEEVVVLRHGKEVRTFKKCRSLSVLLMQKRWSEQVWSAPATTSVLSQT